MCSFQILVSTIFNCILLQSTSNTKSNANDSTNYENWNLPKELYRPILYSWIITSNFTEEHKSFFELNSRQKTDDSKLFLFRNLFRSTYFLNKLQESESKLLSLVSFFCNDKQKANLSTSLLNEELTLKEKNQYLLLIDFILFNNNTLIRSYNETFQWVATFIDNKQTPSYLNLKWQNGLFVDSSSSYSKVNELSHTFAELTGLRNSINDQISLIQQHRWIYKYNILHRASFLNATYITLVKQLLSVGFYDSSLLTNNVWAGSSIKNSKLQMPWLGDLTRAFYGHSSENQNYLENNLVCHNVLNPAKLSSLSRYESSYYWFLTRSFNLATLPSTTAKSLPIMYAQDYLTQSTVISNYATQNLELTNSVNTLISNKLSTNSKKDAKLNLLSDTGNLLTKDVYLKYSEFSLFSKVRLDTLLELNTNFSTPAHSFYSPKLL